MITIVGKAGDDIDALVDGLADYWQHNPPHPAVIASALTAACMLADANAHPEGSAARKWRQAIADALAEHVTESVQWWWPEQAADLEALTTEGNQP